GHSSRTAQLRLPRNAIASMLPVGIGRGAIQHAMLTLPLAIRVTGNRIGDVAAGTDRRGMIRDLRAGLAGRAGRYGASDAGVFDTFARNIDVAALDEQQFVHLLETLRILDHAEAGYELRHLSTDTLAAIVRDASKDQLAALEDHRELRRVFLDEIFGRMSQHFLPAKATHTELVMSWRFSGGTGPGGYDRYQTIIEDGTCRFGRNLSRDQHTTLTL